MRVCFFGDSFVNGTGDDDCLGWVGRLCANARKSGRDLTCYNLGIRRDTSEDVRTRWRREAECRLPVEYDGRIVFSFGANDAVFDLDGRRRRVEREETLANATAILREAIDWRPTLMLGPLPVCDPEHDAHIENLSEALGERCEGLGVPFFALYDVACSIPSIWREEAAAGDGVHPNSRSYAHLAETIAAWEGWLNWISKPAPGRLIA